jgi:hypothetical protein
MMAVILSGGHASASTLIPGYFLGQAEAIEAQTAAGPLDLVLGNGSGEGCPCRGTNGHTLRNTVASLNVGVAGNILTGGVNTSTAYGLKTDTTATTTQTTKIAKINLLGGLITADALKAVAEVDVTASALTPSFTGSKLVNLVVAGQKVPGNVPENTVLPLPGLGTVTVKFVNQAVYGSQAAGIEVEMLQVNVTTQNSLGLPVGAVLIVGEAFAGYDRTEPAATLGGYAQTLAVSANAGSLLDEAASAGALTGVPPCTGTGGQTLSDSVANIVANGLLTISTASTTAFGGPVGHAQVAETTASIGQVSLLGGLITANTIEAAAAETYAHGQSTASTLGSTFGSLNIAGQAIAANVPANTVISLVGLGYVVLNEQPPAEGGTVQVNGLHIVVNAANNLGLPVGAELFLAHAQATASKF